MAVHCGTHVDAPRHFIEGAPSITDYPVGRFVSGAVMVSVVAKALQVITVADLESAGAQPRAGDMLFIRTGWGSLFNADNEAEYYGHHPYLSPEVADWVLEKGVRAIGTDTLNPEPPLAARPPRYAWPIHCQLLANDVLIFENLNLEPLAGKRSCRLSVVAAPIAITESDGAPARVIAQLADE
jgi:kynurenine formamidase